MPRISRRTADTIAVIMVIAFICVSGMALFLMNNSAARETLFGPKCGTLETYTVLKPVGEVQELVTPGSVVNGDKGLNIYGSVSGASDDCRLFLFSHTVSNDNFVLNGSATGTTMEPFEIHAFELGEQNGATEVALTLIAADKNCREEIAYITLFGGFSGPVPDACSVLAAYPVIVERQDAMR